MAAGLLAACSTPPVRSTAQIRAQGFNTQGMDRYKAGDLPHALGSFEQALQVAQSIEDDDAIAVARLNLSMVYLGMGRQDEALKQLDGVLDDPRLAFSSDRRAEAALRRAMAVQAGDRAAAAQALDRADALCGSRCSVRGKILNLKAYLALQRRARRGRLALRPAGPGRAGQERRARARQRAAPAGQCLHRAGDARRGRGAAAPKP